MTKNSNLFQDLLRILLRKLWPKVGSDPVLAPDADGTSVLSFKKAADDLLTSMPFDWSSLSDWLTVEVDKWVHLTNVALAPAQPVNDWDAALNALNAAIQREQQADPTYDVQSDEDFRNSIAAIYASAP